MPADPADPERGRQSEGLQEKKNSLESGWHSASRTTPKWDQSSSGPKGSVNPGATRAGLRAAVDGAGGFLTIVLPRLTHQTVEYQEVQTIFIGDVKPSSFTRTWFGQRREI